MSTDDAPKPESTDSSEEEKEAFVEEVENDPSTAKPIDDDESDPAERLRGG